jgi:thioredoxin reductase (NADPH)
LAEVTPVTIVGAGPSGIAAAIYLKRAGFDPLLLDEDEPGGLLRQASLIENYPGFPTGIDASRLIELFLEHLSSVGGSVTRSKVTRISKDDRGIFQVKSSTGLIQTTAVIIATGTKPRKVEITGSDELVGKRVFYNLPGLMLSSSPGERIAVYGGGDAAVDYALNLDRRGYRVTVICRSIYHCIPLLEKRLRAQGIDILDHREIKSVSMKSALHICLDKGDDLQSDRLLIACGREPRPEIHDLSLLTAIKGPGEVIPGLFLSGDLVAGEYRQLGIAVGSGLNAAMMAERYLRGA